MSVLYCQRSGNSQSAKMKSVNKDEKSARLGTQSVIVNANVLVKSGVV